MLCIPFLLLALSGCEDVGGTQTKALASVLVKPAKILFNETIQPILSENCYACHGPDLSARKVGLRLDRPEGAFSPHGKMSPAIVKGDPDASPLIKRVESSNEKEVMPPADLHKRLKPAEIALLRRWISEGAEYQEHWAFIAPRRPAVPAGFTPKDGNEIDAFVRARLARENLQPSPEADRRTLIRRVSLDLTGIIPTAAEVDAFVADKAPGAYGRVVDRLLASPRYGEHRARYWLDYARYADTHGIHFDNFRAISPYRDYVINAYNSNKPFSDFVREQLAADLMAVPSMDRLAATGFVRCNLTTNEGGDIPEETYVNQTRDRVEALGATFLGLTTGCAACHDHKYDPFSQRDFYNLAAIIGNTSEKPWDSNIADPEPVLRYPKPDNNPAADVVFRRRAALTQEYNARIARGDELVKAWILKGGKPKPVASDALELRLRLDEGKGDVVANSAAGTAQREFKAETNPPVWGENAWLWPSMRMDINSRLNLGKMGDVDLTDSFSTGGWIMIRQKPGNINSGNGPIFARRGDDGSSGWDVSYENGSIVVSLMAKAGDAKEAEKSDKAEAGAGAPKRHGIVVRTTAAVALDEWTHVFITFNGKADPPHKAGALTVYLNGKAAPVIVLMDSLTDTDSIRTGISMELGRRDEAHLLRESRYQDIRFYRRKLEAEEVPRLLFEDVASEILARKPDMGKWSVDERFVVVRKYFFGETDPEAMRLAASIRAHSDALAALTRDGDPTLIANEKETPPSANLLKRGDYYSRLDRVEGGTPHFLPPMDPALPVNRLGLAEWLLSPSQPLMSRVVVNRMWQEVFGRGLVETAADFGVMGAKPSHPELLDWLAVEFRESGWDVKRFYKLMVMSATYRQSSAYTPGRLAKDPANTLLSGGPRFRMDAEMLRDSALEASGLLVDKIGGPSVKPYQPAGLWEEVAMPESNTRTYVQDKGEGLYRRSLYTFWKRGSMPPAMEAFDATSRETACTRRARTDTPLQAFVTMNDPQWVESARKLAERAVRASPGKEKRLDFLARTTLGRPLTRTEEEALGETAATFGAYYFAHVEAAKDLLGTGDSPRDPSVAPAELATWAMVASEFLNADEFLNK